MTCDLLFRVRLRVEPKRRRCLRGGVDDLAVGVERSARVEILELLVPQTVEDVAETAGVNQQRAAVSDRLGPRTFERIEANPADDRPTRPADAPEVVVGEDD